MLHKLKRTPQVLQASQPITISASHQKPPPHLSQFSQKVLCQRKKKTQSLKFSTKTLIKNQHTTYSLTSHQNNKQIPSQIFNPPTQIFHIYHRSLPNQNQSTSQLQQTQITIAQKNNIPQAHIDTTSFTSSPISTVTQNFIKTNQYFLTSSANEDDDVMQ